MNQVFRPTLNDTAIQRRAQVFTILEEICQDLEWTQSQFERARTSYEAVADWLAGSSDPLLASLHVYLHGSGALGTSIKPIGRDEFDVDLISFISGLGPEVAPGRLKAAVGARLREHSYYATILDEKKRCWRLDYAGEFHLDISPTIANPRCFNGGEFVPDRIMRNWHATNPRAYRALFDKRAELMPRMTQSIIAMQKDSASVEPFPIRQSVKGILRRTVQLLKRHRDQHFLETVEEVAPISVVITTLAMKSYEMCVQRHVFADELEVLVDTIRLMPLFIERPLENGRQIYAVWNETTQGENFAERWNDEPARVNAFYEWHAKALADFEALRDLVGLDTIVGTMKDSLGDKLVARTMNRRMETLGDSRKSGSLVLGAGIGLTTQKAAASTPVPKNDFFGD
ncbi:nucleotidyltransferase [Sulfitobacter sp. AS92]|uniref:nucleotidyltransferase domain-containing protein n=1 Tax=Sulfitobacter sp. AS92 TaxID=3135783 RepID=UPI003177E3AE